ncbi:MAG TPA: Holliday junction branch migration protein RuvA [Candidatus Babeliaceae bacterium]|nr:Holliday junction branch migration protein RuvA [Candidatus Babeliaceae bacterium]
MINFLQGIVTDIELNTITVNVAGIGFGIIVPQPNLARINETIQLYIHLQWNQEQGPLLYGFNNLDEKRLFTALIAINGFGPKIGISLLASLTPHDLVTAIITGQTKTLSAINGIGAKKAETLILHLKDKITKIPLSTKSSDTGIQSLKKLNDVLQGLGYSRQEIEQTLESIKASLKPDALFDETLRKALTFLSRNKLKY